MTNETCAAELTQGIIQSVGEVERCEKTRTVVVSTPQGILRAHTAVSCLIQPACGDVVLVAQHATRTYILSVLERPENSVLNIQLAGNVTLSVEGELSLQATNGLLLDGGSSARLRADKVGISGDEIEMTAPRISVAATALNWLADTLESSARVIKQTSQLWSAQARTHQRQVEDIELVRVGSLDLRAKELINIGATHTIVKSRELVKIDGKQIQVG